MHAFSWCCWEERPRFLQLWLNTHYLIYSLCVFSLVGCSCRPVCPLPVLLAVPRSSGLWQHLLISACRMNMLLPHLPTISHQNTKERTKPLDFPAERFRMKQLLEGRLEHGRTVKMQEEKEMWRSERDRKAV